MRSLLAVMILTATALAGCAGEPTTTPEDQFQGFEDDLQATATTGIIRGVIADETISPLPGATITVRGTELHAETDENGLFGFTDMEPGNYFLEATKKGYTKVQSNVAVVAGVDKPEIARFLLEFIPGTQPYITALTFNGHLTCGAAVFATSVGCTTSPQVAEMINDASVFAHQFDVQPSHVAAELVWEDTQAASGMFIWEITPGGNTHIGYRETTPSPALAYLDQATIEAEQGSIMDDNGINFRFFAGPHELCDGIYGFGCGVTLDQGADAYIHEFHNMLPTEGWRFTIDGDHPLP
jgi:hypothetical protein